MGTQPREVEREEIPRLLDARACNSSRITILSEPNNSAAPLCDNMSAICSGVVSRISGGDMRWRARRDGGVSPVRVSSLMGKPISSIGVARLRAISTASALSGET